jgi:hypothetical protein
LWHHRVTTIAYIFEASYQLVGMQRIANRVEQIRLLKKEKANAHLPFRFVSRLAHGWVRLTLLFGLKNQKIPEKPVALLTSSFL